LSDKLFARGGWQGHKACAAVLLNGVAQMKEALRESVCVKLQKRVGSEGYKHLRRYLLECELLLLLRAPVVM
jgi:hypothetical protein